MFQMSTQNNCKKSIVCNLYNKSITYRKGQIDNVLSHMVTEKFQLS